MTERDALYREILDRPDDLFLREVYADHLEDAGEVRHAAQIRAELAGAEYEPVVQQCVHDSVVLSVETYRYRAVAELLERGFQQVKFRRGFVDWVAAPLAVLLKQGPWLVRNHPVTEVVATGRQSRPSASGRPGWWNQDRYSTPPEVLESDDLPEKVWNALRMDVWNGTDNWKKYKTFEEADADLSYALLKLARSAEHVRPGSPDVC